MRWGGKPTKWLEVSLTVDGELAEAVADVLGRFVPNGVAIESLNVIERDEAERVVSGFSRICGYLPVDEQLNEVRLRLEEALWYLGSIQPLPPLVYKTIQETDWSEAWKKHYNPVLVGKKLAIVPAWLDWSHPERIPVRMNPGMAFGTGTHPSTQLCLEIIEIEDPVSLIDIGCGSGILAIAALKMGTQRALGVDTDPQAIHVAHENAALNGVQDRLELGEGSVAEIHRGIFSLQQAPLVVSNILAGVIIQMLEEGLGELITLNGHLVLSGILEEQAGEVEAALRSHGLQVQEYRKSGDWVVMVASKDQTFNEASSFSVSRIS